LAQARSGQREWENKQKPCHSEGAFSATEESRVWS
jgi:hypothetical protein